MPSSSHPAIHHRMKSLRRYAYNSNSTDAITNAAAPVSERGLIQHQRDDHAPHRDVEPDRECPPRDPPMPVVARAEAARQRDQRERRYRRREHGVREQDAQIHASYHPLTGKMLRAHVCVVDEVRDQKEHGGAECRDHYAAVLRDAPSPDEPVADCQQDGGRRIQRSIDRRKIGDAHVRGTPEAGTTTAAKPCPRSSGSRRAAGR